MRKKKSKENEHCLADLSSVHRRSQAKCQLEQISHLNKLNFSCLPFNKHLINHTKSVCMGES